MLLEDIIDIMRMALKAIIKSVGLVVLGILAFALFIASAMGFFYGLMQAINGKDLIGGILLTIFCNSVIFFMYVAGQQYILPWYRQSQGLGGLLLPNEPD